WHVGVPARCNIGRRLVPCRSSLPCREERRDDVDDSPDLKLLAKMTNQPSCEVRQPRRWYPRKCPWGCRCGCLREVLSAIHRLATGRDQDLSALRKAMAMAKAKIRGDTRARLGTRATFGFDWTMRAQGARIVEARCLRCR